MTLRPLKVSHITTIDMSLRYLLLNQLRSIQQEGYNVTGISSLGENLPVIEAAGIRHIAVPMTRDFTPLADLVSPWKLYRVMRRERFTIVHTHNPKPEKIAARCSEYDKGDGQSSQRIVAALLGESVEPFTPSELM